MAIMLMAKLFALSDEYPIFLRSLPFNFCFPITQELELQSDSRKILKLPPVIRSMLRLRAA